MIVKGLIKSIDYSDNSCMVRLPIFETAATKSEVVLKAVMLSQPGMYNGYAEGDVVFVDFENDKLNQPIVIGKLFLGPAKENTAPTALSVANLTVSKSATLPIDTKLVLEDSGGAVPVENGITSYKSLTDIIKALYKAESSAGQIVQVQSDSISNIKVEYLSQPMGDPEPEVDDERWAVSTPTYAEGMSIWQKTTCFNSRGQILNAEILCLSTAVSSASYRLRCSSRIHAAKNQAEPIIIQAMVKLGTSLEVEDTSAFIGYSWGKDGAETLIKGASITLTADQLQEKNLLVTFKHVNALDETKYDVYDTDTVMYAPLNTPILHLDNDSDSITYAADGGTVLSDPVTSTATLYLNGDILDADYSWELTNCSNVVSDTFGEPVTVSNTNTITIKSISSSTRSGTAVCTATVKQEGAFKDKTYTKVFSVTQTRVGENASSYWLASTCRTHQGSKQEEDIIITAKTQHGVSPEEVDEDAYIWWKYSSATTWTKSEPKHRLLLPFKGLNDDTIVVVATHDIMFNPEGMSNVDLITSDAVYEVEEIPFSPLNTPIINLTNDMAAIAYTAEGTKLNDTDVARTTAELWLNGTQIIGNITYSWDLVNCTDDQDRSGTGNITTPSISIKTLTADIATATCTITYKEEPYSKTFTIVKQVQGKSPYVVDIYNDFVTVPADDTGTLSNAIKSNLETLTTHTVSCYHGDEPVIIAAYSSTTPTVQDKLFRVKYTTTAVTLSTNSTLTGPNFAVTNLSDTVGYINYELYQGTTRLASAKFEVSKLIQGESSISYWLKLSSGIHLGANQQQAVEVTAMQKIGTEAIEDVDENAQLFYRYKEDLEWIPVQVPVEGDSTSYNTHYLTLAAGTIKDQDLIIKAVHNIEGTEVEYETETITYSPLNTPALDLENDTDTILYPANEDDDYNGPLGSPVKSKATLYLNGNPLEASYTWTLINCSADLDANVHTVEGQEVTVSALSASSGSALVVATVLADGAFKDKTYSKVFTVSKVRKGDNGINSIGYSVVVDQPSLSFGAAELTREVTITGTCYIHDGQTIQPFGGATYTYKIDTFDTSSYLKADAQGKFTVTANVESQVEICLIVGGKVIDKEIIRVLRDGKESASIESQTTYYALIHNKYTTGQIKAPTGDSENDGRLVRKASTGEALKRLDTADTLSAVEQAECWGPWSLTPPAHTNNTNGWKYWTTIRTKFSNSIIPQYSIPITNEDLSSIYALVQGKTTSYYSPTDPAKTYTIKTGDCWFCTPTKTYSYVQIKTPAAHEAHLYIGRYISPDNPPKKNSVYIEVTEHNLDAFLQYDGEGDDGIIKLVPGTTKAYRREDNAVTSGGILYQWNGMQWEDIGEELIANKITANYINAFDITAKKIEVLDTDNAPLFEADGLSGSHKVQLGGFEVEKNTLTTGSGVNLIRLNSDITDYYGVRTVSSTEVRGSSWTNTDWQVKTDAFKQSSELKTIIHNGNEIPNLFEFAANNLVGGGAQVHHYYAVTKVVFKENLANLTIYLSKTAAADISDEAADDAGDYLVASTLNPADGIPNTWDADALMGTTFGTPANTVTKINYTNITAGDYFYIVYVHGSGPKLESTGTEYEAYHNDKIKGTFYIPTSPSIRLSIGNKFQVLADGTVYAKSLYLGPTITDGPTPDPFVASANETGAGTLAAVKLISGGSENKTSLNDDNKGGIYLGPDGLSIGTGFKVEAGGGASFSDAIRDDLRGFSVVTSVSISNFTESDWTTHGTIGYNKDWGPATASIRNGCRVGDLFTVVGTATDSGKAHVLYYKSTTADGNLEGTCMSHSVSERGVAVSSTTKYYKLSTENLASDGNQPNILEPSDSASAERNRGWNKSPATFPTDSTSHNYYESVRSLYADGSFEWSVPVKNSMLTVDFINSLGITAKHIEVRDGSGSIFKANAIEGSVDIAGFHAANSKLSAGAGANYVEFGTEAIMLGGEGQDTAPFYVSKAGNLKAESGLIGGFTLASTGITSANNDLQLLSTGQLVAKAGDIGGFEINPSGKREGLYSDYLTLNAEQVYFPVQAHLNLNDKVKIYSATPSGGAQTSYIATVNDTDFIIQNQSGAGIKFAKDDTTTNVDVKLTVTITDIDYRYENRTYTNAWGVTNGSGMSNWLYSVYVKYTAALSQPLPYPVTCKMILNWQRMSWSPHESADYAKVNGSFPEITFDIPTFTTTATFSNRVYEYAATQSFSITSKSINGTTVASGESISVAKYADTNNSVYSLGHFLPNATGCSLGSDSKVWSSLHILKAEQYTSDRRLKNSVQALSPKLDLLYDQLKPVSYKFNEGTSDRQHFGFIAQDIQQSLAELNIDSKDFAPLCIPKEEDAYMSIRYTEFISLNTAQIQKLKKRVAEQDNRIEELERIVKELQQK